jgi:hypothetical protein
MPAKAGIQYSETAAQNIAVATYWIIRRRLSSGTPSRDPLADDDTG